MLVMAMAGFIATFPAFAQSYPAKQPVRIVVPFAPGGTDTVARALAQKLIEQLGQSVLVDNRPGGGGIVGTEVVAKAPADGYTLLFTPIPFVVNVSLVPKLPFDPVRDFAPIVQIASAPNILLIHPSVPVRTMAELVKLARARPGELSFASGGNGSSTHLAAELFKMVGKVELLHVPYKGGVAALTAVISGEVSMYIASMPAAIPTLRSGRLRGLGITSKTRAAALPDMPTTAESGLPGYEYMGWYGLLAPAGTPHAITTQLNAVVNKILKTSSFAQQLAADGAEPVGGTSEAFAAFVKSEIAKWADVIKHARIRAQ
ncbi:MAG: tripartite tricarboxylate transporter substrate binding protein [Betaproteobacteria bacterium]|nr:tripartite tricarboxylate transporter substrate binding protein [Betaproteobacteria bacterium]